MAELYAGLSLHNRWRSCLKALENWKLLLLMKYLFAILTVLSLQTVFATKPCEKCDLEKVRIVNQHLTSLTDQMLSEFLCTFDNACKNNVEYTEFSNETLFAVLDKAPNLFFQVMSSGLIDNEIILKEIENPINDRIDLQEIYDNIKLSTAKTEFKTKCLNALILTAEKSGLKLIK
jgi:hypothetical protein